MTGLDPAFLFESGNFSTEDAKEKGIELGLCPYALTKWALQFAEIWIGDTNYLFAPNSRNVFWETYGRMFPKRHYDYLGQINSWYHQSKFQQIVVPT